MRENMDQRTRADGGKHASAEAWMRVLLSQDHACVGYAYSVVRNPQDALISAVILPTSIVPTLNNTIDVRTCFIKCRQAGFMDIYNQCYIVVTYFYIKNILKTNLKYNAAPTL